MDRVVITLKQYFEYTPIQLIIANMLLKEGIITMPLHLRLPPKPIRTSEYVHLTDRPGKGSATLTMKEWYKILLGQDFKCQKCKRKFTKNNIPTMDHIIPYSKGGVLTRENVQALCMKCNLKKRANVDKSIIISWI
jgi:hypothetical protein